MHRHEYCGRLRGNAVLSHEFAAQFESSNGRKHGKPRS